MDNKKTTKTLLVDLRKKADKIDEKLIALIMQRAALEAEIKYIKSNLGAKGDLPFKEQMLQDRQIAHLVEKYNKEFHTQIDVKGIYAIFENIDWIIWDIYAKKKFDDFF